MMFNWNVYLKHYVLLVSLLLITKHLQPGFIKLFELIWINGLFVIVCLDQSNFSPSSCPSSEPDAQLAKTDKQKVSMEGFILYFKVNCLRWNVTFWSFSFQPQPFQIEVCHLSHSGWHPESHLRMFAYYYHDTTDLSTTLHFLFNQVALKILGFEKYPSDYFFYQTWNNGWHQSWFLICFVSELRSIYPHLQADTAVYFTQASSLGHTSPQSI